MKGCRLFPTTSITMPAGEKTVVENEADLQGKTQENMTKKYQNSVTSCIVKSRRLCDFAASCIYVDIHLNLILR